MPCNAKISLVGSLVRDPEMKEINGQQLCSFTVAVKTMLKKDDGSYDSNFYDCSVWGKRGEYFMPKAQKGTLVWVTGELALAEYVGKDGQPKSRLRVTADTVEALARLKDSGARQPARTKSTSQDDVIPF